jgi:hypothetical protein
VFELRGGHLPDCRAVAIDEVLGLEIEEIAVGLDKSERERGDGQGPEVAVLQGLEVF